MKISTLFCDVGGVLLTNGWDHHSREKAAEYFQYDFAPVESRHGLIFENYEVGKITLDQYLQYVVFFTPRSFSAASYKEFMYQQSKPFPEMLKLIRTFKEDHHLKTIIISNEGRELMEERFRKFDLKSIGDIFMVSCFIRMRKPDLDVFRLALNLAQVPPEEIIYIDDRELFVEIADSLGMHGIHHKKYADTLTQLNSLIK